MTSKAVGPAMVPGCTGEGALGGAGGLLPTVVSDRGHYYTTLGKDHNWRLP